MDENWSWGAEQLHISPTPPHQPFSDNLTLLGKSHRKIISLFWYHMPSLGSSTHARSSFIHPSSIFKKSKLEMISPNLENKFVSIGIFFR
jgi:hypothetical protein